MSVCKKLLNSVLLVWAGIFVILKHCYFADKPVCPLYLYYVFLSWFSSPDVCLCMHLETTGGARKMGGNFKEKLRELGGLDAVFEVIMNCHSDMEV